MAFIEIAILLLFVSQCKADYLVEHSLNGIEWSDRGRLLIDRTSRSGSISIHDWSDDEIDSYNELAKSPNSFYKLRIKTSDDAYLIGSVLTCQLTRGDERIVLHSDSDANLIGFDYYTSNPTCSDYYTSQKKGRAKKPKGFPKSLQKTVEVSMSFGDKGDSPYMPEYEASPPKQEQTSFWKKYWWVILIVGFVFLNSIAGAAQ